MTPRHSRKSHPTDLKKSFYIFGGEKARRDIRQRRKRSHETERVEHETHAAYAAPPFPTNQTQHERNKQMKLTKADLKQKRAELEDHREARRGGRLATPSGVAKKPPPGRSCRYRRVS